MAGDRLLVGLLLDAGRETLPPLVTLRETGSTAGKPAISGISDIPAKVGFIAANTMVTPAQRRAIHGADAFTLELLQLVGQARWSAQAKDALLNAVRVAREAANTATKHEDPLLTTWLGEPPSNPAELEFRALQARFAMRRELLAQCIGSSEVVNLLGLRNRQTPLDRLKAKTLLAISDKGQWRFPLWQFDPDGPDGVVAGLPEVLAALSMPDLTKARWLQRPQALLDGQTPLQLLREGQVDRVLAEARSVGCGQD